MFEIYVDNGVLEKDLGAKTGDSKESNKELKADTTTHLKWTLSIFNISFI